MPSIPILCSLASILAFVIVQQLRALPSSEWFYVVTLMPFLWPYKTPLKIIYACFYLSFVYSSYQAYDRLQSQLPSALERKTVETKFLVTSISTETESNIQFDATILDVGDLKIPKKLRVYWNITKGFNLYKFGPKINPLPKIEPGQIWYANLKLQSPSGLMNPGGFDTQTYMFRKGYRVTGSIKGHPQLISSKNFNYTTRIEFIRHKVRERLLSYVNDKKYGGIIIALVMGDQSAIPQSYWQLFNRTGITHLVSISGSHITMLSTLATLAVLSLGSRVRRKGKLLNDKFSIQNLGLFVGLVVAFAYCQMAGWGVPAQRTFLMLLVVFLFKIFNLKATFIQNYLLVAVVILIFDPWAIHSVGFYLSFAAVAVLQYILNFYKELQYGDMSKWKKLKSAIFEWTKLQLVITFAITPFLIIFFNQISIVSPLVNAYAIFLIGSIITPACLLLAMFTFINPYNGLNQHFADSIHWLLYKVMKLTEYINEFSWASIDIAHSPFIWLSVLGVVLFLVIKNKIFKLIGLVMILPSVCGSASLPQKGDWKLIAFDVGQGGGVLIFTKNKTLLFDTGVRVSPNKEGFSSVFSSSFRYLGVHKLDYLVVSHGDIDHTGGMAELIHNVKVGRMFASFKVDKYIDYEERETGKFYKSKNENLQYDVCRTGVSFTADGVKFTFLYPKNREHWPIKSKNEDSCVLLVEGRNHSALLTGDILEKQELGILPQLKNKKIDLIMAAHHGSKSSSNQQFVNLTRPKIVIAQAGYMNMYGHPHKIVKDRWTERGSEFLVTFNQGAIEVTSDTYGLKWKSYKNKIKKYWHRLNK
ncbi:DNA internalization-related competence protein ComEC/Rec2 [Taylorella equigenitalis]|uniref:DNA internalization-related competence protein ComEC/Rec2 n=1 Tax=Taylorella equigenitalis TaxID=29575 RepID=UPI00237E2E63|nr:DNA internalization-related competence protein ComEC/Rec2 [Taylorella equigenitalis]WDU52440.1 DNA internalization-related competence protein ComEC/Rec2 [Taylorella equigenitalis]